MKALEWWDDSVGYPVCYRIRVATPIDRDETCVYAVRYPFTMWKPHTRPGDPADVAEWDNVQPEAFDGSAWVEAPRGSFLPIALSIAGIDLLRHDAEAIVARGVTKALHDAGITPQDAPS